MIGFYKKGNDWLVGEGLWGGSGNWEFTWSDDQVVVRLRNDNVYVINCPYSLIDKDDTGAKYASFNEFADTVSDFFLDASSGGGDVSWGDITGNPDDSDALDGRLLPEGGAANQVPKKQADGSVIWAVDTNTTYTAMTASEATAGTSTTARTITAKVLHDKIIETPPSIAFTTTGTSGASTYNAETGALNIPVYANTTYATMTAAEATTGTVTTARTISAKVLNDAVVERLPEPTSLVPSGGTNNQVLKIVNGVPAWGSDANSSYSVITEAEITDGTATRERVISAQRLKFALDSIPQMTAALAEAGTDETLMLISPKVLADEITRRLA